MTAGNVNDVEPTSPRRPGLARDRIWMSDDLDAVDSEIERAFLSSDD